MRPRLALLLALALAVTVVSFPIVSAHAAPPVVLAQQSETEQQDPSPSPEGQDEPAAESGAEDTGAAAETGPVWTYQMARIGLVMLVLLLLGVAGAYRNFVHKRAKEGI